MALRQSPQPRHKVGARPQPPEGDRRQPPRRALPRQVRHLEPLREDIQTEGTTHRRVQRRLRATARGHHEGLAGAEENL